MKKIIPIVLLLAGCASYVPPVPAADQARPTYRADLSACQDKANKTAQRLFGPLGGLSYLYNRETMTDAELQESEDALTADGKKRIITTCMIQKGYQVQP